MKTARYRIPLMIGVFEIGLHEGTQVLKFGELDFLPTIWVLENQEAPIVTRRFFIIPATGGEASEKLSYLGTCQIATGPLVHLFEPVLITRETKCMTVNYHESIDESGSPEFQKYLKEIGEPLTGNNT